MDYDMDDNKMPGPVAWSTPGQFRPWATRESERVMKLTKEEQPEHDFITPLYSAETVQALQAECEEQARLNGMGAEREARLMARVSELQAERDALANPDAGAALALLSRMRWACGDNGKRMQDELEDYLRGLAKDAARYRWLRKHCEDTADEYGTSGQLYFGTYAAGQLDAAIDAAMSEGER